MAADLPIQLCAESITARAMFSPTIQPPKSPLGQNDTEAKANRKEFRGVMAHELAEALAGKIAHDQRQANAESLEDFVGIHADDFLMRSA